MHGAEHHREPNQRRDRRRLGDSIDLKRQHPEDRTNEEAEHQQHHDLQVIQRRIFVRQGIFPREKHPKLTEKWHLENDQNIVKERDDKSNIKLKCLLHCLVWVVVSLVLQDHHSILQVYREYVRVSCSFDWS